VHKRISKQLLNLLFSYFFQSSQYEDIKQIQHKTLGKKFAIAIADIKEMPTFATAIKRDSNERMK